MRIGVVQLCSTDDIEANLEKVAGFVEAAAEQGACWVALPENFAFMRREGLPVDCAEDLGGRIVSRIRELAAGFGVWILAGSFAERIPNDTRVHNTSVLVDDRGEINTTYRKIHLFDVDLGEHGGGVFRESDTYKPGESVVVAQTPFGRVGLSICYDVRFPELYRQHAAAGADFLCVPSAFAPATGRDHWEVLLRARAIENQAFVVAPAQWGQNSPDRASYGRSLVVDPWGVVVAKASDAPGLLVVDCDLEVARQARHAIPALSNRRL